MPDSRQYLDPKVVDKLGRLQLKARLIVEGFLQGAHESPYRGVSVESFWTIFEPRHLSYSPMSLPAFET